MMRWRETLSPHSNLCFSFTSPNHSFSTRGIFVRHVRLCSHYLYLKALQWLPPLTPITIPNCYCALKDPAKIWGLTSMTLLRPCHLVFQSFKEIPVLGLLHLLFLTHGRNFTCPPSFFIIKASTQMFSSHAFSILL